MVVTLALTDLLLSLTAALRQLGGGLGSRPFLQVDTSLLLQKPDLTAESTGIPLFDKSNQRMRIVLVEVIAQLVFLPMHVPIGAGFLSRSLGPEPDRVGNVLNLAAGITW